MPFRRMSSVVLLLGISLLMFGQRSSSGDVVSILTPDTVCVNQWINPDPDTVSGSGFNWSYCSANAGSPPSGTNLGTGAGVLNNPMYVTGVRSPTDCYAFLTNAGDSSLVRIWFGSSFANLPVTFERLTSISMLSSRIRGIQILQDEGVWQGFLVDGSMLYRFNFAGNSLSGNPQILNDIPFPNVGASSDLIIRKEGAFWVGFVSDSLAGNLVRLRFMNGLSSAPQIDMLGNVGDLNHPTGLSMAFSNGLACLFVSNTGNATISRIDFGSSFLNPDPAGINLGNPGALLYGNTGIRILADCEALNGYVVNSATSAEAIIHLTFPEGLTGIPVAAPAGNPGGITHGFALTELMRRGDTIQTLISNTDGFSITRLTFLPCSAASRPGDIILDPPPFFYTEPGQFNINLSWIDETANPLQICHPVVVLPELTVDLGADQSVCEGTPVIIDAGPGYEGYTWSNGSTNQTVTVSYTDTVWVIVSNRWGCQASDTVAVTVTDTIHAHVDTTVCYGTPYWAGGNWQTASGVYHDTLSSASGCDSVIQTSLTVKPAIPVDLGPDTLICPGEQIVLDVHFPGATFSWQDGSADSLYTVTEPGQYWVAVTSGGCSAADTVLVKDCPPRLWFPTAFTPNGDGLNDTFRPSGISIVTCRLVIFDRWGRQVAETDGLNNGWDGSAGGEPGQVGNYTFVAWYTTVEKPDQTVKVTGTFSLVR